jgi:hypothetical protein
VLVLLTLVAGVVALTGSDDTAGGRHDSESSIPRDLGG